MWGRSMKTTTLTLLVLGWCTLDRLYVEMESRSVKDIDLRLNKFLSDL